LKPGRPTYLPIERHGASLFFRLVSRRYVRGPLILTSNQSFSAWGKVFGDRVISTAILDRLLHYAVTLNFGLVPGDATRRRANFLAPIAQTDDGAARCARYAEAMQVHRSDWWPAAGSVALKSRRSGRPVAFRSARRSAGATAQRPILSFSKLQITRIICSL